MTESYSDYQILVVEDTMEFAQLTMLTLERQGFKTAHAPDGETAVEMIAADKPSLILLDLNLPGMSGWQVLEYVTEKYGDGNIPVIVTTAYSDSANRVVGKLRDVHRYLVKPFRPEALREAIDEALGIKAS